jgi:hypothetical protein
LHEVSRAHWQARRRSSGQHAVVPVLHTKRGREIMIITSDHHNEITRGINEIKSAILKIQTEIERLQWETAELEYVLRHAGSQ